MITITAADPAGLQANQGFAVTVEAASRNAAPVAVGTIPGSRLQIGGTSTIDVAGYFNDPDGDELSYMGASSNEAVATVAMEGSSATITAIAAGDAVITITASDGSASVSQGFRIDVPTGPKEATVVISRLLDANRQQISDPTGIAGTIYVVLDVESNDETWTEIGLTMNGETVEPICRGGASPDASAGPGLAAAGQAEIECVLKTDAYLGECVGMQLMPKYANGEYTLSAYVETDAGDTRAAVAPHPIALGNSNYVKIQHNPGSESLVVAGVTYYGGPTTEDNLNTFDVCPVVFDETVVGTIGLRGMTDTQDARSVSFLTHRRGRYGEYYGARRSDSEPPFTFEVLSSQNAHIEDIASTGNGGHWIIQDGPILDPDGVNISDRFVAGDPENERTKIGPVYFDFAAPRLGGADAPSQVQIGGENVVAETYYSDVKNNRAQALSVSNVTEAGSGGTRGVTNQVIAVGDCSVGANTDGGERGAGTPFVAIVDDANVVGDIPEDDPFSGELSDDGGVECYTAELQSLSDPLGNSRGMSQTRIQSAEFFGVDRGAPVVDNEEPDEVLVLKGGEVLTFDVEDPELESGEMGSGLKGADDIIAFAGSSYSRRYWDASGLVTEQNGMVTIPSHVGRTSVVGQAAGEDGRHTVTVWIPDKASPANYGATSFTFVRDTKAPNFVVSQSQPDIGRTTARSVLASVGGKITDANVIRRAELSIKKLLAGDDAGEDACLSADEGVAMELSEGRTGRVPYNTRDLENDSNDITVDEEFTIRAPTGEGSGPETYCFFLEIEDVASESDGRGEGNIQAYEVGRFSVQWPAGPAAPPPGPTFEFTTPGDAGASPPVAPAAITELNVTEGVATATVYAVKLANVETAPTAQAPLTVTIDAPSGVTVAPTSVTFPRTATDGTASDTAHVSVTAGHDLNIVSEVLPVTHSATGYEDAPLPVTSLDEDFEVDVDVSSVDEDADAVEVTVTVTAGTAPATGATHEVALTLAAGGDAADADFTATDKTGTALSGNALTLTIAAGMTSADSTIMVSAVDDTDQNEVNDLITVGPATANPAAGQGLYVKPDEITINDADPDVMVSLDPGSFDETDDNVAIEVTATRPSGGGVVVVDIAAATTGECSAGTWSATTLTIDQGSGSSSATVTITVDGQGDFHGDDVTCQLVATIGTGTPAKASGTVYTVETADLTIRNADNSTGN